MVSQVIRAREYKPAFMELEYEDDRFLVTSHTIVFNRYYLVLETNGDNVVDSRVFGSYATAMEYVVWMTTTTGT
jgi:hypothetical protein